MPIPSARIVTGPYSLIGYALCLVFILITTLLRKNQKKHQWVIPAGVIMAFLCAAGGLALAWKRESHENAKAHPPSQSMHIDSIQQTVPCGDATAGVQGNVTNASQPCEQQNPKQKGSANK